jgi:hypothetical protein
MEIILIYVVVLALFASIPMVLDICLAYRSVNKTRNLLIEKASLDKFELHELQEFIKESGKAPPGTGSWSGYDGSHCHRDLGYSRVPYISHRCSWQGF